MKSLLFSICFTLLSAQAFAERFTSDIHSISPGQGNEDDLIMLSNGRVVFASKREGLAAQREMMVGSHVEIEVDKKNNLKAIYSLPAETLPEEEFPNNQSMSVQPKATVVESLAAAQTIFNGMNRSYYSKTECTDRAHVWTFEEWKKRGLISKKVFLFFTNTYIRRYRYNWWFHVSPYNLVQTSEGVVERVMDRRYTSGPRAMKTWTDVFIYSRKECPDTTYRYYRANRNGAEHCYKVKSEMYYRLPLHVRNLEDYGTVKTRFSQSEVNFSYRAFRRRGVR